MAARKCNTCDILYPTGQDFVACPVCETFTDYKANAEPEDLWQWKAQAAIYARTREEVEQSLVPTVEGHVTVRDGQMWVSSWDVYKAISRRLQWTDLFQIGKQVFEVLEYVHERREYLVRPFQMTLSEEDLQRFCDGCGGLRSE